MRFAAGDIETGGIGEHAMWPRKPVPKRIGPRSVAARAVAKDRGDDSRRKIDSPNHVVLGVCHKQLVVARICEPLRSSERRLERRAAVPRVSLLAGARKMVNRPASVIDAVDGIA